MEAIVTTQTFDSDLEAMVAFTRTLDSRQLWPGSTPDRVEEDTLHYGVGMQLDGAPATELHVEEAMSPVVRLANGQIRFTAKMRTSWPTGHTDVEIEYVFTPGEDGAPHSMQYTYRYEMPDTSLLTPEQRPAFHQGLRWVSGAYLKAVAKRQPAAPVGAH
jgi:hypothetical protein